MEPCEEDAEDDDDLLDDEGMLAKASTMIYQLQHKSFLDERRAEITGLWQQLEENYGVKVSSDTAQTLQALVDEMQAEIENGGATSSGSAVGGAFSSSSASVMAPTALAEATPLNADEAAELEAAGEILSQGSEQLQAMQRLRSQLEASLLGGGTADANGLGPASCSADDSSCGDGARRPQTTEQRRLKELRSEVERMREASSKDKELATEEDARHTGTAEVLVLASTSTSGGPSPEERLSGALEQWLEDMRWLSAADSTTAATAVAANSAELRGRQPASQQQCRALPTPLRRGHGSSSPASKKELARIAEERAMDWAAAATKPARGSPTKAAGLAAKSSPKAKAQQDGSGLDLLRSPLGSQKLQQKGSALLRDLVPTAAAGSPSGTAAGNLLPTSTTSPERPKTAMEKQLDDILNECDEIDRIHAGMRQKLTCA